MPAPKNVKIVGSAYREPIRLVKEYAKKDIPLLFVGETGVGKELFARLYMEESVQSGKKGTRNCAAYPESMLRAEVFGHEKGAFTDAKNSRAGMVRASKNGILFLDELGAASQEFQAAILRIVEGGSFNQLGSDKEIKDCDTVIIAATNNFGSIRQDLKFRFNILPIPPLQKSDIPALATHFFQEISKDKRRHPKKDILEELINREYPGNVRDLKKVCERVLVERGDENDLCK